MEIPKRNDPSEVGHALDNIASTDLNKSRMAKFRH